jgi:hypothetical protein
LNRDACEVDVPVNDIEESENDEDVAEDEAGDLEAEPGAVGKGVKQVALLGVVLGAAVNDDSAERDGNLIFRVNDLGNRD